MIAYRTLTAILDKLDVDTYSLLGKEYAFNTGENFAAVPEDRAWFADIARRSKDFLAPTKDGKVDPLPFKVWEGGLTAIPDGLDYLKENYVSHEKIVFRVA